MAPDEDGRWREGTGKAEIEQDRLDENLLHSSQSFMLELVRSVVDLQDMTECILPPKMWIPRKR